MTEMNNKTMDIVVEMAEESIKTEMEKVYVIYNGMVMSMDEYKEMREDERGF